MIKAFVVGAIAGGVAYWLWGNEINRMVEVGTRVAAHVRRKVAAVAVAGEDA